MNDYTATIRAMYRAEVGRLTEDHETVDRRTVFAFVEEAAAAMHARGELEIPVTDIINAVLIKADEKDGSATDSAIRSFASGQFHIDFEGDSLLAMVVTLGRGKRKLWRDFTVDDLTELDRLRFRNVASVQTAYAEWRESFDVLLPQLLAAGTIGALAKQEQAA